MFEVGKFFQEAFFIKQSLPSSFSQEKEKQILQLPLDKRRLLYSALRHAVPLSIYLDLHYPKWKKKKNASLAMSLLFLGLEERIFGEKAIYHTYQWLNKALSRTRTDWLKPIARSMLEKAPEGSEQFFNHIEKSIQEDAYMQKILLAHPSLDWKLLFSHPPLWARMNSLEAVKRVPDQDIIEQSGVALALKKTSDQTALLFAEGVLSFQNISSQSMKEIFPTLVTSIDGKLHHIIETCAAPGGKSGLILDYFGKMGVQITLTDLNESKAQDLETNLSRIYPNLKTQFPSLEIDIHDWSSCALGISADLIFVDAPCSGSGVTRKHPDVLWRDNCEGLNKNIQLQKNIVENGLKDLRKGGIIVYSTCSLDPDENENLISQIMARNPDLIHIDFEMGFSEKRSHGFQILPSERRDGLYICILKKGNI